MRDGRIKMLDIGREMNTLFGRYKLNTLPIAEHDYLYATTTPNESNADGNLRIHNGILKGKTIENKDPITLEQFTNGEPVLVLEGIHMFKIGSLAESFRTRGRTSPLTRAPVTNFSNDTQIARYTLVIFPNAEPSSSSSSSSAAASTHFGLLDIEFKGVITGTLVPDGDLTFIRIRNKNLQSIDSTILDPITHTRFRNGDEVIVAKGVRGRLYLFKRDPLLAWFEITGDNKLPINGDPVTLDDIKAYKLNLREDDEAAASAVASASTSAAASVQPPNHSSSYELTGVNSEKTQFPADREFYKLEPFVFKPSFGARIPDTATVSPKDTVNIRRYVQYTDEEPYLDERGSEKSAIMDGKLLIAVTVKADSCSYTVPIGSKVRVEIVNAFNKEQTRTILLTGDYERKEEACSIQGGAGGRRRRGPKRARRGRRRSSRKQ